MQMAEVRISDDDFGLCLREMRLWLDSRGFTPSSFTYFYLDPGMLVRVLFDIDGEAGAFAQAFDGAVIDETSAAADHLPVTRNSTSAAAIGAD